MKPWSEPDPWMDDDRSYGYVHPKEYSQDNERRWLQAWLDEAYMTGRWDERYEKQAVVVENDPMYRDAVARIAKLEQEIATANAALKTAEAQVKVAISLKDAAIAERDRMALDLQAMAVEMREAELERERELEVTRSRPKTFKRIR